MAAATDSAISLWGAAFHDITKHRRKMVLQVTGPVFVKLLSQENSFSQQEYRDLFGRSFLNAIVRLAGDEATLSNVRRPRQSSRFQPRNQFHRTEGAGGLPSTRFSSRPNSGFSSRRSWSSGFTQPRFENATHQGRRPIDRYVFSPSRVVSETWVGARLAVFGAEWRTITTDPWIIDTVESGYRLEFTSQPHQAALPRVAKFNAQLQSICDAEVHSLLGKKAIIRSQSQGGFVSSLFVIPKKSGGHRPIINLKPLNDFIIYEHFKLENLETARL